MLHPPPLRYPTPVETALGEHLMERLRQFERLGPETYRNLQRGDSSPATDASRNGGIEPRLLIDQTIDYEDDLRFEHHHLAGTTPMRFGVKSKDAIVRMADGTWRPSNTWILRSVTAIRDVVRRTARADEMAARGMPVCTVHDDRGRPRDAQPSDTVLVHPLLRAALHHAGVRHGLPTGEQVKDMANAVVLSVDGPSAIPGIPPMAGMESITAEHDIVHGRTLLRPDLPDLMVAVGPGKATITHARAVPDTHAQALGGQPLSALVQVPPTGDRRIDQAVAGLSIQTVSTKRGNTHVLLTPTPWIAFDEPAEPWRWIADHPLVR